MTVVLEKGFAQELHCYRDGKANAPLPGICWEQELTKISRAKLKKIVFLNYLKPGFYSCQVYRIGISGN